MAFSRTVLIHKINKAIESKNLLFKIVGYVGFFAILLSYVIQGIVMIPFILFGKR